MAEVGIAQFRKELRIWLERARSGDEVVVTERGQPVARLSGIDAVPFLDRLVEDGRVSGPASPRRPTARGRKRAQAEGDVSDHVIADRDSRR